MSEALLHYSEFLRLVQAFLHQTCLKILSKMRGPDGDKNPKARTTTSGDPEHCNHGVPDREGCGAATAEIPRNAGGAEQEGSHLRRVEAGGVLEVATLAAGTVLRGLAGEEGGMGAEDQRVPSWRSRSRRGEDRDRGAREEVHGPAAIEEAAIGLLEWMELPYPNSRGIVNLLRQFRRMDKES